MTRPLMVLALAASAFFGASGATARAETLVWDVRSTFPYKVYLKFFSQDRDVAWPSFERAWVLADSKFHAFHLNCRPGETICFGAGTDTGKSVWGVGPRGQNACGDCCRTCGGGPGRTTLSK